MASGSILDYWNVMLPFGEVVGRHAPDGSNRWYYLKDHLGSVRAVVGGSQTITRDYYPFGLPMDRRYDEGSPPTREDFTGYERGGTTGLLYAGARYYLSAFGRWTATDRSFGRWGPRIC